MVSKIIENICKFSHIQKPIGVHLLTEIIGSYSEEKEAEKFTRAQANYEYFLRSAFSCYFYIGDRKWSIAFM